MGGTNNENKRSRYGSNGKKTVSDTVLSQVTMREQLKKKALPT